MISVVIPAFNARATIADQLGALAEAANHDVAADFEVVVADNGSRDDTRALVEAWCDRLPLRVVDASARQGPAAARNIGASAARGDLLVFTDADDVIMPGWLAAWSIAAERIQFGSGPIVSFAPDAPIPRSAANASHRPPVHMDFLPYAFGSNFAVRAQLFERHGGFPEDWRTGEDVVLSWRLQLAGVPFDFVEQAAVARRTAPGLRRILAQHYAYGVSDPRLFREFRAQGIRRPPAASSFKTYLGLVARLPLLFDRAQRERWAAQAGRRAGRLAGSARQQTLYW